MISSRTSAQIVSGLRIFFGGVAFLAVVAVPVHFVAMAASLVDDPEPVGRFSQLEMNIIEKAAQEANATYPRMGAVITPVGPGYILGPFTPAIFSNGLTPYGACDSEQQCTDDTDALCGEAGAGHSDSDTTEIQTNPATGDQVCSSDCTGGGTAVIACNRTIIDDPDPTGHTRGGNLELAPTE
jgi:hypothetical protein